MKKLILTTAIILGSFTTFAQTSNATKADATKADITTKTDDTKQVADGTKQAPEDSKYKEIKLEDVPTSVILAEKTAQPEASIEKAYINEKKEYKLDIKVGDQKSTVYTDVSGNVTKK